MNMGDMEFEIFDEETSKKIQDEHEKDMEDAAKTIGARRMGLITGNAGESTTTAPAAGKGLMSKLSSATSLFSRKKTPAPTPTAVSAVASPMTAAAAPPAVQVVPAASSAQAPGAALPPPPSALPEKGEPEAPPSTNMQERPPQVPATVQPTTPPEASGAGKDTPPVPVSAEAAATEQQPSAPRVAAAVATPAAPATGEESTVAKRLHPQGKLETEPTGPTSGAVAETVIPGLNVVTFDVREPSLGAAVVGHVAILEGSCYVWAATEGSSAQGSLAAAVGTRFDGGMPTATPLLAGEGVGEAGAAAGGGVSVSMAQRLCRRTGRVVFVSCDLSEDSQILVAAVEAKVVALLKAED